MADVTLTAEQAAKLREAKSGHDELQALLDRARAAGLDVDDHQARLDKAKQIREGLLREFPPDLPGA